MCHSYIYSIRVSTNFEATVQCQLHGNSAAQIRGEGRPAAMRLAVSTVIFALRRDPHSARRNRPQLWLPLVCRLRDPYDGYWALPGGPLQEEESLSGAAARTLAETTGLRPAYLEQLYAFGDPERSTDPHSPAPQPTASPSTAGQRTTSQATTRQSTTSQRTADRRSPGHERVVSIVYWALVGADEAAQAKVGQNVRWLAAEHLPPLAFDHNLIVDYALWRLRTKMEYARIAHAFLGETFTLRELREVHEVVLQRDLDPANFRRQVEADGAVVATEEFRTGGRHRPARLYRYNHAIEPVDLGPLPRSSPAPRRPGNPRRRNDSPHFLDFLINSSTPINHRTKE